MRRPVPRTSAGISYPGYNWAGLAELLHVLHIIIVRYIQRCIAVPRAVLCSSPALRVQPTFVAFFPSPLGSCFTLSVRTRPQMFIKSIEITGFKSYRGKLLVEFDEHMNVIGMLLSMPANIIVCWPLHDVHMTATTRISRNPRPVLQLDAMDPENQTFSMVCNSFESLRTIMRCMQVYPRGLICCSNSICIRGCLWFPAGWRWQ
jgi:hypothetical protein